jgi:hypothetical protein
LFEKGVLRTIFGNKRQEVIEGKQKLHTKDLHDLYFSLNIITLYKINKDYIDGACGTHGKEEKLMHNFGGVN